MQGKVLPLDYLAAARASLARVAWPCTWMARACTTRR